MSSMKKLIHSCHYAGSQFCNWVRPRAARLLRLCRDSISWLSRFLLFHVHPFWIQLGYYLAVSLAGYLVLKATARDGSELRHRDLDLFFTSVSATTASSMSTVEMEELSRAQLLVMIVLMLLSGEVFTSLLELQLLRLKLLKQSRLDEQADRRSGFVDCIELGIPSSAQKVDSNQHNEAKAVSVRNPNMSNKLKYDAATCLSQVVLGYILVFHVLGSGLITLYVYLDRDAKQVLERKGLRGDLFSLFTMVSTFASCGFVPLNEGMVAFRKSPGLLLILIPQVLAGNTLYAPCLHAALWALEKASAKRKELGDALRNGRDVGYFHLVGSVRCRYICLTALLFVTVQLVLFCGLEWRSGIMSGLTPYQKLVCSLFQVVNSRYAGESAFDLSMVSPAVLVLFLVMMYLPPYTSFAPEKYHQKVVLGRPTGNAAHHQSSTLGGYFMLSQISYLVICVVGVCITERRAMVDDPLNFSALNIAVEVISAYGNVGFTTGYSCERRLKAEGYCKDATYGFVGRWSKTGKLIIVAVMFFGKLSKFSKRGGQAWDLS
ncbi:hypothetical protein ACJRO7_014861 [Eucalyptus globulus]|uniref:Uncharacterized protein n=2 Tax=Eucalyptus globulus TaxID=34317 RepID=A0ABD3L2A8_EUCGL